MLTRNRSDEDDDASSLPSYYGEDEQELLDDLMEEYEYRTGSSVGGDGRRPRDAAGAAAVSVATDEGSDGMVRGATILGPGSVGLSSSGAPGGGGAAGGAAETRPSRGGSNGGGWTVVSDDDSGDCLGEVHLDDCAADGGHSVDASTLSGSGTNWGTGLQFHPRSHYSSSTRPSRRGLRGQTGGGDLSIPESIPSEMGSITIERIDEGDESLSGAFRCMSRRRKLLALGAAVAGLLTASLLGYNGYRWRREAARLEEELKRVREERELALRAVAEKEEEREEEGGRDDASPGDEPSSHEHPELFAPHAGGGGRADDPTFAVDNCWIRAEANVSLGQCAADVRDALSGSLARMTKSAGGGFQSFYDGFRGAARGSWENARDGPWTPAGAATAAAAAYAAGRERTRTASRTAQERARDATRAAEQTAKEAARAAALTAQSTAKVAAHTARYAERFSKRAFSAAREASASIVDDFSGMAQGMNAEVLGVEATVAIEEALGDLWSSMKEGIEEHASLFAKHTKDLGAGQGHEEDGKTAEQGQDKGKAAGEGTAGAEGTGNKGAAASAAEMLQKLVYL